MKALTVEELESFFWSLESEYEVRAPIALQDGTRTLGSLHDGRFAPLGGHVLYKPVNAFFPQFGEILVLDDQAGSSSRSTTVAEDRDLPEIGSPDGKPLLLAGLTAEDADCLDFTDRFFSTHYRDDVYWGKRETAVIIVISGRCGRDGEFLRIAGGKCDIELIFDGMSYLVSPYSDRGLALEKRMPLGQESDALPTLERQSAALSRKDEHTLSKASELIRANRVPDAFWARIADRCIACTACNMVCPTCTCFDVLDWRQGCTTRRCRVWDSCQYDGFMREASGHNPLGTETLRTRRRIHHKLAADVERWGHVTCFLCGRCDEVCPTQIGIMSVSRAIVSEFGSEPEACPATGEGAALMAGDRNERQGVVAPCPRTGSSSK